VEKTLLNPDSPTNETYQTTNTTQHLEQETDIPAANEDMESETRTPVNVADTTKKQSEPLQELPEPQAFSQYGRPINQPAKPSNQSYRKMQEL
jgi:hypothetical protein